MPSIPEHPIFTLDLYKIIYKPKRKTLDPNKYCLLNPRSVAPFCM